MELPILACNAACTGRTGSGRERTRNRRSINQDCRIQALKNPDKNSQI